MYFNLIFCPFFFLLTFNFLENRERKIKDFWRYHDNGKTLDLILLFYGYNLCYIIASKSILGRFWDLKRFGGVLNSLKVSSKYLFPAKFFNLGLHDDDDDQFINGSVMRSIDSIRTKAFQLLCISIYTFLRVPLMCLLLPEICLGHKPFSFFNTRHRLPADIE